MGLLDKGGVVSVPCVIILNVEKVLALFFDVLVVVSSFLLVDRR